MPRRKPRPFPGPVGLKEPFTIPRVLRAYPIGAVLDVWVYGFTGTEYFGLWVVGPATLYHYLPRDCCTTLGDVDFALEHGNGHVGRTWGDYGAEYKDYNRVLPGLIARVERVIPQ